MGVRILIPAKSNGGKTRLAPLMEPCARERLCIDFLVIFDIDNPDDFAIWRERLMSEFPIEGNDLRATSFGPSREPG